MFGLEALVPSWEVQLLVSALIAVLAVGAAYAVRRVRRRLLERLNPILVDFASAVLVVATVIVTTLVIADIWGQAETLVDQMGFLRMDERAPELVVTIIVLISVQIFTGIAARLLRDLSTESDVLTEHQREVSLRVTQITLWATGSIVILGVWEVDLTGLLVGAGFLGIVLGLASRKTIGSLIAGFVLMFSRPFEVGDWVVIDDEGGVVSDITLLSTRLQAFDGEYIVVPNDVVIAQTVTNRSRQKQLRVEVEVGIDYDDEVEHAREVALTAATEVMEHHDAVLETAGSSVLVREFGNSAVILAVRVWVENPTSSRVNEIRDDLICTIKAAFEEADVTIPYPQRELSGRDSPVFGGSGRDGTVDGVTQNTHEG